MKIDSKKMAKIIIPLIIALISMLVMARFASSPEFHEKTIQSLDEKKITVMELTATSTAVSAAITLIPGDVGNPIAEKLADLSSYFLLVLCALYLEKYLLTITGWITFMILIPAACVLFSVNVVCGKEILKRIATKMVVFGAAIVLVVPASVKVADMIEATYDASIENTIESAKQTAEEIEGNAEDEGVISGIISKIKDGVKNVTTKIETVLSNFVEALAVMIVTSCVIPIVVILIFIWLIKMMLGMDLNVQKRISQTR